MFFSPRYYLPWLIVTAILAGLYAGLKDGSLSIGQWAVQALVFCVVGLLLWPVFRWLTRR